LNLKNSSRVNIFVFKPFWFFPLNKFRPLVHKYWFGVIFVVRSSKGWLMTLTATSKVCSFYGRFAGVSFIFSFYSDQSKKTDGSLHIFIFILTISTALAIDTCNRNCTVHVSAQMRMIVRLCQSVPCMVLVPLTDSSL